MYPRGDIDDADATDGIRVAEANGYWGKLEVRVDLVRRLTTRKQLVVAKQRRPLKEEWRKTGEKIRGRPAMVGTANLHQLLSLGSSRKKLCCGNCG